MSPQLGNAPKEQELRDGGFLHSPFIKSLAEDETWYCTQLAKWWKTRNPESGVPSKTIQLGPNMGSASGRRQHRLFCDTGPEVDPQGYFDCTFEVKPPTPSMSESLLLTGPSWIPRKSNTLHLAHNRLHEDTTNGTLSSVMVPTWS